MNIYQLIESCLNGTLAVPENWEREVYGPENPQTNTDKYKWTFYAGGNDWEPNYKFQAVVTKTRYGKEGEYTRVWIKLRYPEEIAESKDGSNSELQKLERNFGENIAHKWISTAKKIYQERNHLYNEWSKSNDKLRDIRGPTISSSSPPEAHDDWAVAFNMALDHEDISPWVDEKGIDVTKWNTPNKYEKSRVTLQRIEEKLENNMKEHNVRNYLEIARILNECDKEMINGWEFNEELGEEDIKNNDGEKETSDSDKKTLKVECKGFEIVTKALKLPDQPVIKKSDVTVFDGDVKKSVSKIKIGEGE